MKIGNFIIDVTPPVGNAIAFGINEKTDFPISIRGVIIDDGKTRVVLAACDFINILGKAYGQMRKVIANAAGTEAKNVFLHSLHQHDSVRIALELNEVYRQCTGREITPLSYYNKINEELKLAVSQAADNLRAVKNVATAERRISGLASNRRLLDKNGKVYAMRFAMCTDPKLQKEPTGLIDPVLRSIGFIGSDNKLLAIMHFYASHPQTAYHRNRCSSDVPGFALDYAARHCGNDAFQIYFTGCGGNVTFGKYYKGETSFKRFGERLGRELVENCNHLELKSPGKITVKHALFELPLKMEMNEKDLLDRLNKAEKANEKISLTRRLVIAGNWEKWKKVSISRISIGEDVNIMSLPDETVVEYQLYAQSLIPEKFLACAAYADTADGSYIPTAVMYNEGGYEPGGCTMTTAEVEPRMRAAIDKVLKDLQ
ncbi:MAG: hypothetical protein PHV82_04385 [Victivallaceae bacterium]|nr:hypothetical protein [Victivallaceae bacterium]